MYKVFFVFIVSFFFCNTLIGQGSTFAPTVFKKDGYISTIYNEDVQFYIFSSEKVNQVNFHVRNNKYYFDDSSLVLVFYGTVFPRRLKEYFCDSEEGLFLNNLPDFSKPKKLKNQFSGKQYWIKSAKVKFSAFDYKEYEPIEGTNGYKQLIDWGIFGRILFPKDVKSNNRFIIVTCFK